MLIKKIKSHWPKILSIFLFILLIGSYTKIFAIGAPYSPGETLDPSCPPGEINCTVLITSGGSSVWTEVGDDIYYDTGNVGIGTNIPSQALEVDGNAIINGIFLGKGTGSGSSNIALGNSNLQLNTIGYNNIGIGEAALQANTTGGENIAIGIASLNFNETGSRNIAIGDQSLNSDDDQSDNVAIGYQAGLYSVGGSENVLIGNYAAGSTYGDISSSVIIGFSAGYSAAGVNNIFLGSNAGAFETGSNKLIIDNLLRSPAYAQEQALIYGVSNTTPANQTLSLGGGGNIGIGTATPTSKLEIKLSPSISYSQSFSGSGLNDAIFSGTYIKPDPLYFPQETNRIYVQMLGPEVEGDYVHVYDEIGSCTPYEYVITDSPTLICNGIYITFDSVFGHNMGDVWTYEISDYFLSQKIISANDGVDNYFTVNTGADNSNFIGDQAGSQAYPAINSNFLGLQAGYQATNAYYSNFLGFQAGYQANDPSYSGDNAEAAYYSNFLGSQAGYQARKAKRSNFFGGRAGYQATNAESSNFFGLDSGYLATNASASNFLGLFSGTQATNALSSNFFGTRSGYQATNASNSNFIGRYSGQNAASASNSIFIGQLAGNGDTVNNTGNVDNFSILIGKSTNTGGFSNSIALGGSAVNTASNEFMIGSTTRPINTTVWVGASGTATLDTATGLITTSDERLKKNITDLEDTTLDKLINVRTVNFNWINGDSDKTNIGFLAQDLENYFPELVYTGTDDYKGVNYANMTPILVEAIREMDLKVKDLDEKINNLSISEVMKEFFGGVLVGVTDGVAYLKNIVVENLKVGSPEKRTGITLYDEETGEPYCLSISGGQTKTKIGECGVVIPDPIEIVVEEKEKIEIIEITDEAEIGPEEILTEEKEGEEQKLNVTEEDIIDQNEDMTEEVNTPNIPQIENTEEQQNPIVSIDN